MKKKLSNFGIVTLLLLSVSLLAAPGCGGKPNDDSPLNPAADYLVPGKQSITFRVLNGRDRPVRQAKVTVTAIEGRLATQGPFLTNRKGEVKFEWMPQAENAMPGMRDSIISYTTKLDYKVAAKGHFSGKGRIESKSTARVMASKELQSLNTKADIQPWIEVVVIRAERELWAGELRKDDAHRKLKQRLKQYYDELSPVAAHLGAKFAWPAFALNHGTLRMYFDWTGTTWSGLASAPLKAQVTLNSGIPLAMAAAEDLLPIKGVRRLTLEFISPYRPPDDPYAAEQEARITLDGPVEELLLLSRDEMSADEFLERNPVKMKK